MQDPEAASGKAIRYEGDGPADHAAPVGFGVYDGARLVFGPSITLEGDAVPRDEKYHLYRIGRFPITNGVLFWAHASWWISVKLDSAYNARAASHDCEVYASVRVCGPAYVPDSSAANSVSVDRVLLVRDP